MSGAAASAGTLKGPADAVARSTPGPKSLARRPRNRLRASPPRPREPAVKTYLLCWERKLSHKPLLV